MRRMRDVGNVSVVSDTAYAFFIDGMALTVRHWTEKAIDGDESGARLELQRLHEDRGHGSEFAMARVSLEAPIWRADLFSLANGKHDMDRAHHHPYFTQGEPCDRVWLSDEDAADPVGWTRRMLTDGLDALLDAAGADDLAGAATVEQIAQILPLALLAVRYCLALDPEDVSASGSPDTRKA